MDALNLVIGKTYAVNYKGAARNIMPIRHETDVVRLVDLDKTTDAAKPAFRCFSYGELTNILPIPCSVLSDNIRTLQNV